MVDTMRDARRSCTLSCSHWTGQNEDQDLQSGSVDGQGRGQAWGWRWGLGGIQRRRSLGWAARWEQDFDCCRRKPLDLTKETWTESLGLAGRIGTRGSVAAYKETFKGDSFNRFGALSAIKPSSFYSPPGSTQMQALGLGGQGWRWSRSLTLLQ